MEIPAGRGHLDRLGIDRTKVATERATGSIVMLPILQYGSDESLSGRRPDAAVVISALRMLKSLPRSDRLRKIVHATVAGLPGGDVGCSYRDDRKRARLGRCTKPFTPTAELRHQPLFVNTVAGPDRYALVDSPPSDRPLKTATYVSRRGRRRGWIHLRHPSWLLALVRSAPSRRNRRRGGNRRRGR